MTQNRNLCNGNGHQVRRAGSGDLFNGFFEAGKQWSFQKDQLVDSRARRVFDLMGRACEAGVYPYQLPLEGRSGHGFGPKAGNC